MKILLNIVLLSLLLLVLVAVFVVLALSSPLLGDIRLPEIGGLPAIEGLAEMESPGLPDPKPQEKPETLPTDMARYYSLKNTSCQSLSGDFLIMVSDSSKGKMSGFEPKIPEGEVAASIILDNLDFNKSRKTYVRGDWLKIVDVMPNGQQNMTIWKAGRVYRCKESCTMGRIENDSHQLMLDSMREDCMHFGKTPLPEGVSKTALFNITYVGKKGLSVSRCDEFLISANRTYAIEIMENYELDSQQESFFRALSNMDLARECLDDGTGIIAERDVSFDLTDDFMLEFAENGSLTVKLRTRLLHYQDDVPESFFALPG